MKYAQPPGRRTMNGLRISRTALLGVALLFCLMALVMPLVHSIVTYGGAGGAEVEEVYTLWGVERTIEGQSNANPHGTLDANWGDAAMDGTGGISYIRAAMPLVLIGMVVTVAALILTVVPRTGENRSGGWTAGAGFVFLLVGFVLYGWGLVLRNGQVFSAWVPESVLGAYLMVLALLLIFIAALLGMISTRVLEHEVRVSTGHAAGDHSLRYFQCNTCGEVRESRDGRALACTACGNESRKVTYLN